MSIEFNCESCGKHYKVADAMAGKRAKCKACGAVLQVPAHVEGPADSSGLEIARENPASATPSKPPSQKPAGTTVPASAQKMLSVCPSCQAPLPPNAVLCINCGFDLRKGVKIAGVSDNDDASADPSSGSKDDSDEKSPADKKKQKWWAFWSKGE